MDVETSGVPKKRRRPPSACLPCRQRKKKCDQCKPCNQCIRLRRNDCVYDLPENFPPPRNRATKPQQRDGRGHEPRASPSTAYLRGNGGVSSIGGKESPSSSTLPGYSAVTIQALSERLTTLEQRFDRSSNRVDSGEADKQIKPSSVPSLRLSGIRGSFANPRFIGQPYWINSIDKLAAISQIRNLVNAGKYPSISDRFDKCSQLGKVMREQRTRHVSRHDDFRKYVPQKVRADELLEAYFRTFESIYRVLHVPSFRKAYDSYWENPQSATKEFGLQLLLALAIGSSFCRNLSYDATETHEVYRWIHLAQSWLMLSFDDSPKFTLSGVQTYCLLLLAREANGIEGESIWISAGSLLRLAMVMGLNRDPSQITGLSSFQMEMRRRLWATVIEIQLQGCLDASCAPLISLDDFDTLPPSNIDDEDLDEQSTSATSPKPSHVFTQNTLQIALSSTLPCRLRIAHAINKFSTELAYADAIWLGNQHETAYRSAVERLQSFDGLRGAPSYFQAKMFDCMNCRFLLELYQDFLGDRVTKDLFFYARKVRLDVSMSLLAPQASRNTSGESRASDFYRMTVIGSGMFRNVPCQSFLMICYELQVQIQDQHSTFAHMKATKFSELTASIDTFLDLARRRIEAGEVSFKSYVWSNCIAESTKALQSGVSIERPAMNGLLSGLETTYDILRRATQSSVLDPSRVDFQEKNAPADAPDSEWWSPFGQACSYEDLINSSQLPDDWMLCDWVW